MHDKHIANADNTYYDGGESVDDPRGPSYENMLDQNKDGNADVCYVYSKTKKRVDTYAFNEKAQRRKCGKVINNTINNGNCNVLKWDAVGFNNGTTFVNNVEMPTNKQHS